MIRWLTNRWQLYKLNRQQRELDDDAERVFKEAKKTNEPILLDNWEDKNYRNLRYLERARRELVSVSLLAEADELHLPRPPYDDKTNWERATNEPDEEGQMTRPMLTDLGMTELRQAIRKERKERREVVEFYLKFIPMLTGLIGALIGLFAIFRHK